MQSSNNPIPPPTPPRGGGWRFTFDATGCGCIIVAIGGAVALAAPGIIKIIEALR